MRYLAPFVSDLNDEALRELVYQSRITGSRTRHPACTSLTKRLNYSLSSDTRAPFWRRVSAFGDELHLSAAGYAALNVALVPLLGEGTRASLPRRGSNTTSAAMVISALVRSMTVPMTASVRAISWAVEVGVGAAGSHDGCSWMQGRTLKVRRATGKEASA